MLIQQSSALKNHVEAVYFFGTLVATGKNMIKFSRRKVLHPINNRGNADNSENENIDFSIDLHYHQVSTPARNINSTLVSTPHHSHSSFLQNHAQWFCCCWKWRTCSPSRYAFCFSWPIYYQCQTGRLSGHSIFLEENLCVILHILELKSIAAHAYILIHFTYHLLLFQIAI